MVKKELLRSMGRETLWVNCSTRFLIYCRKAYEYQRLMRIMVKVVTTSRYIDMAAPERMEWLLMLLGWNPR